ncbi:MAG: carboxylating nicotinate-nucleotide diphosphorylase [Thermoguttaceae bacterium]
MRDFEQSEWNIHLQSDLRELVSLAIREDGGEDGDITSRLLIPKSVVGAADVVSRAAGVAVGIGGVDVIFDTIDSTLRWEPAVRDGDRLEVGTSLGVIFGRVQSILTAERIVLNLLGRLCGVATLTSRYVAAVNGMCRVYDTRKTTLGWRRLEKYAVRCGGGYNHRLGLRDAILIKDNHLAFGIEHFTPAEAVYRARERCAKFAMAVPIIEIEVDSLSQLRDVLPSQPDIVLLDNMTPSQLREAASIRRAVAPNVELEASGGITLETISAVAAAGVDRISVGSLTHSATTLDLGLDWISEEEARRRMQD